MKKISTLLMLFCAFVGAAWAQLPTVSDVPADGKWATGTKWYTIQENKSKYVSLGNVDANGYLMLNSTEAKGAAGLWCVVGNETNGYQFYNYQTGTTKVLGAFGSEANGRMKMYDLDATKDGSNNLTKVFDIVALEGQKGYAFVKNHGSVRDWWNNRNSYLAYWNSDYAYADDCTGSQYTFTEVEDFSAFFDVAATKTAAVEKLSNLKKINLFDADATTIDAAIAAINAVEPVGNSLDALNEAFLTIQTKLNQTFDDVYNTKTIRLTSYGRDATDGHDLTVKSSGVYGTTNSGDAGLWTMKGLGDGSFALYNFVSNLYLGPTVGQSAHVPSKSTLAEAGRYTFNLFDEATQKVNLITNGNNLHLAGGFTIVQWWDNAGSASQWVIEKSDDIVMTRDTYDTATAAASSLPFAIQSAYGVLDATKYTSNAKESSEGSYEGLIDGAYNDPSYFHSTYNSNPGDYHYLQVELNEAMKDFYFYFKKRQGNNNNRPTEIEILGSVDGNEFTTIKTINSGLPTDAAVTEYISDVVSSATNVKYVRFVVKATNNSAKDKGDEHPFFTFSEFYVVPATSDVTNLISAYISFASSSITSNEMATAATALINAETTLALSNIKKEVKAILDANVSNHATTPALGQYTTASYNALSAAYDDASATQESLETAIAAFKKAKNVPVYFITSKHNGYAAGSAIYYDGAWKWKTANKYDKQMWMTIADYYQANVPAVDAYNAEGTSYAICDYLTGTKMRGKDVQIVKVEDWESAYNLQYNADANSTDAAQHAKDTKDLVGWKPGTKTEAQASVWGVEYLGSSYDLAQLTDAHIEAVSALYTSATANVKYVDAVMGSGLGQYTGNKDAFNIAIANAQAIQSKTVPDVAAMNVADITAITTALTESAATFKLNMPTTGFYRVKSMNANDADKKGKYWQSKEDATGMELAKEKDNARSVIYLGEDNSVTSYGCGYALNQYEGMDAAGTEGKAWAITENAAVAGAYALFVNGNTYCLSDWTGNVTYGQNDANAAWAIEEVTVLPVKVSAAGYATFYAPVALTLPEGLTAYTVTVNDGWATLNPIDGNVIPANTGVVLEGAPETYNLTVAESDLTISGNELLGTVAASYVTADAYVLGYINIAEEGQPEDMQVGFYTATKNQQEGASWLNNGFKAYLPKTTESKTLRFNFGGNTTAIESVLNNGVDANAPIYDLSGRRVMNAVKGGIYIQNGKKFIVK